MFILFAVNFVSVVRYNGHSDCSLWRPLVQIVANLSVAGVFAWGLKYLRRILVGVGTSRAVSKTTVTTTVKTTTASARLQVHAKEDLIVLAASALCATLQLIMECVGETGWFAGDVKCVAFACADCLGNSATAAVVWLQVCLLVHSPIP